MGQSRNNRKAQNHSNKLYVKAEKHNIAVNHNIFLAFASDKTFLLCGYHIAAAFHKLCKVYNLGANKATLKIGTFVLPRIETSGFPFKKNFHKIPVQKIQPLLPPGILPPADCPRNM